MNSLLTQYFINKANGMINVSSEVRDNGKGYLMFDDGAVEVETAEYLYGLTKILKPHKVLTTGVYTGISDMYIAQALKENGYGETTALEFQDIHLSRAVDLWKRTEVSDYIDPILTDTALFEPSDMYQLMFLDTELHLRFGELVKFYPYLEQGGYVLIHDMPISLCQGNINPDHPNFLNWPVGEIPSEAGQLIREDKLRIIYFPNPRGMLGLYKPYLNEYKF